LKLEQPLPPAVAAPDPSREPNSDAARWISRARDAISERRNVEALAFARQARQAAPDSPGAQTLLRFLAQAKAPTDLPTSRRAKYLAICGDVYAEAGDVDEAARCYQAALEAQPGRVEAYVGLAKLRMPGPDYHDGLRRIHERLNPETYLEIGVFEGESLAHARPPTVAVAVDPQPRIREPVSVELHLYRETSTDFFTRDVRALFGDAGPSLVFIDGLHEFPAVLADFANVEAIADPETVILLHDMMPFDDVTQRAEREHEFYTGDVWKLLHCLADVRPDLSWFTIRTPPSGLTVVSGLDPTSTVLRESYEKLVERYRKLEFEESRDVPGLVVDNDAQAIDEQLAALKSRNQGRSINARVTATVDTERLSRRVRDLEAIDAQHRREIDALKKAARRSGSFMAPIDEDSALA